MRQTDENHAESADNIVAYLQELGIDAERRSVYRDIDEINKALWLLENANDDATIIDAEKAINTDDYDSEKFIVYDKHLKGFRVVRRKYELSDIRLMAECIYASRYISLKVCFTMSGVPFILIYFATVEPLRPILRPTAA